MPYSSLRDFIDRLEREKRLLRVSAPVSPYLEMTEIQTRLLAEGGPAVLFENVVGQDGKRYDMPMLVNLFGTVERVAWGMDREPGQLRELGETARLPEAAGAAGRLARGAGHAAHGQDGHGDEAEDRGRCALPGGRAPGRPTSTSARLPIQTCWPGEPAPLITWPLIVTKGPGKRKEDDFNLGIYRMQVTGQEPDADALAEASRRRAASRALEEGAARALPRRRCHRGRSRHHSSCGDAGAGHAVGISVRRPAARPQGRAGGLQDRAAEGAGGSGDRAGRPCVAGGLPRRGALWRPHRLLQFGRAVPGLHHQRHHHAAPADLPLHLHRPAAGRAERPRRGAERRVHPAADPAISGDRRFLAAAGRLLLPHRRGHHEERPMPATPSA